MGGLRGGEDLSWWKDEGGDNRLDLRLRQLRDLLLLLVGLEVLMWRGGDC
jgi:hypothetical protein